MSSNDLSLHVFLLLLEVLLEGTKWNFPLLIACDLEHAVLALLSENSGFVTTHLVLDLALRKRSLLYRVRVLAFRMLDLLVLVLDVLDELGVLVRTTLMRELYSGWVAAVVQLICLELVN